jgi:hypothetical protein
MLRFPLIGRLLAVFAIAGLLASPAVTPAIAKLLPALEMSDGSMAADMPCCPDTQKGNDCRDCPLGALCTVGVVQLEPPSATGVPEPLPARRLFAVFDDLIADGIDGRPPHHPPRILV